MIIAKRSGRFIFCLAAILVFAFVQVACSGEKKDSGTISKSNPADDTSKAQNADQTLDQQVVVYYFHGKYRCYTCKRIEQLTREAVEEFFGTEIRVGVLEIKAVNVDEPENRHFAKEYQLFTRSVVVSDIQNGEEKQWKNLRKVWELFQDDEAFKIYIRDEIKAYLS